MRRFKLLICVSFLFLLCNVSSAQESSPPILEVTEVDASPSTYPWKFIFPNGTITDNGDGTTTYTPGAGAPHDPVTVTDSTTINFTLTGQDITAAFLPAGVGTATWGSGSAFTWTFNASAGTDPTIAFGDGSVTVGSNTFVVNTATGKFGSGVAGSALNTAVGLTTSRMDIVTQDTSTDSDLVFRGYDNTSGAPALVLAKARGTLASPTASQANDMVGLLGFAAHDGTDFGLMSYIMADMVSTATNNHYHGRLSFYVAHGTDVPSCAMTIDDNLRVGIGTATPAVKLDVTGSIQESVDYSW